MLNTALYGILACTSWALTFTQSDWRLTMLCIGIGVANTALALIGISNA